MEISGIKRSLNVQQEKYSVSAEEQRQHELRDKVDFLRDHIREKNSLAFNSLDEKYKAWRQKNPEICVVFR